MPPKAKSTPPDNLDGAGLIEVINLITAIGNVGASDGGSLAQSLAPNIGEFSSAEVDVLAELDGEDVAH